MSAMRKVQAVHLMTTTQALIDWHPRRSRVIGGYLSDLGTPVLWVDHPDEPAPSRLRVGLVAHEHSYPEDGREHMLTLMSHAGTTWHVYSMGDVPHA